MEGCLPVISVERLKSQVFYIKIYIKTYESAFRGSQAPCQLFLSKVSIKFVNTSSNVKFTLNRGVKSIADFFDGEKTSL